jgi:hypothetical protein
MAGKGITDYLEERYRSSGSALCCDRDNLDIEVALDTKFRFAAYLPFISGVLPDYYHLRNVRNGFVRPAPSNSFKTPTNFLKYKLQ